jgi:hypothetical protein
MCRAGEFLIILAGVIGAIIGFGLLIVAATGVNLELGLTPFTGGLLGAIVLVFAAVEFAGGVAAFNGRNWYGSMTAGIIGMVTFFTLPLDLVGVILISLAEGDFES